MIGIIRRYIKIGVVYLKMARLYVQLAAPIIRHTLVIGVLYALFTVPINLIMGNYRPDRFPYTVASTVMLGIVTIWWTWQARKQGSPRK